MVIKTAKNQTPRILKSPVAMKAVEKQIKEGKAPKFSDVRRIQVTVSEYNFRFLKEKADRTGASVSGIAAIAIDDYVVAQESILRDDVREALKDYRERIRQQKPAQKH